MSKYEAMIINNKIVNVISSGNYVVTGWCYNIKINREKKFFKIVQHSKKKHYYDDIFEFEGTGDYNDLMNKANEILKEK